MPLWSSHNKPPTRAVVAAPHITAPNCCTTQTKTTEKTTTHDAVPNPHATVPPSTNPAQETTTTAKTKTKRTFRKVRGTPGLPTGLEGGARPLGRGIANPHDLVAERPGADAPGYRAAAKQLNRKRMKLIAAGLKEKLMRRDRSAVSNPATPVAPAPAL
jgi:hypothetical protein